MLRELLGAVTKALAGTRPEPESIRHLKRLAEQLNEHAGRFRTVAARAMLLEQRVSFLETDLDTWERRAAAARRELELFATAARCLGRVEGQLQETRGELATLQADEASLRNILTSGRRQFSDALERARALGHDVSGCLLYVDLTRPECPPDEALLADEDRDFVARVIDGAGVH